MSPARIPITLAAIALTLALGGCSDDVPGAQPDPTPVADSSTPSPSDPSPGGATDLDGVEGPLEPGTYSMAAWGQTRETGPLPRAILEVPEGYFSHGGYVIDAGDGVTDDNYGEVMVWHVDRVSTNPCHPGNRDEVGPTVEDLAQALVQQRGPSTQPHPVSLAGHHGLQLDVTIPADADLSRCPHWYSLWDGLEQDRNNLVDHLWILDVDGTRLVVLVTDFPGQPDGQLQEQLAIADSIRFEPAARS